jgi:hypothetical protein
MKKEYNFSEGKRRAVVPVVSGGNYQTLINQALREYITRQKEPIEVILRRVVREELSAAK